MIRVSKSGAVRIILRSTIELIYAWDLRSLTWLEEMPGSPPGERCVLPEGVEPRVIVRRPEVAPLAGLNREVPDSEGSVPALMPGKRAEATV